MAKYHSTTALERSDFAYEVIDRQLGRMGHLNGTRGHYDRSTLLDKKNFHGMVVKDFG